MSPGLIFVNFKFLILFDLSEMMHNTILLIDISKVEVDPFEKGM
jgi:hypothetical protein